MARKAKKPKRKTTDQIKTSPIVLRRLAELERRVEHLDELLTEAKHSFGDLLGLGQRVSRLEHGHSGDPAAHASLASGYSIDVEQATSDAGEGADASSDEAA